MHLLTLLTLTLTTTALPLNINLGAYSPALVVGDGAISFEEGENSVTEIVSALQGAAVEGAAGVANGNTNGASVVAPGTVAGAAVEVEDGSGTGQGQGQGILNDPVCVHHQTALSNMPRISACLRRKC